MHVFLTQITVPLPVFMVLKSVTVPLLQMAGDNLMDACIQAEVTSKCVKETEVTWLLPGYIQL